jgi:hypothetical protein
MTLTKNDILSFLISQKKKKETQKDIPWPANFYREHDETMPKEYHKHPKFPTQNPDQRFISLHQPSGQPW